MRFPVDFNAETPDGRFFALLRHLDGPVVIGQLVQAHDADGDQVMALIDQVDHARGIVYVRPNWATWIDGDAAGETHSLAGIAPPVSVPSQATLDVETGTESSSRPTEYVALVG